MFCQEGGVTFAALYWEEPDRSGHIFGPDNVTVMGKVLKEVRLLSFTHERHSMLYLEAAGEHLQLLTGFPYICGYYMIL